MQDLVGALKINMMMAVKENFERVKAQHSKIISRQREQVIALQNEKQALEKQVEQEKERNRAGTLAQTLVEMKLGENRGKLRRQMDTLTRTRVQYQEKLDQVAELREELHKSEEELRKIRTAMAEENMKASDLVPSSASCARSNHTHWNTLDEEMTETQAYLDSLMAFLPDENKVRDELAKRLRMINKRPATTGMFHGQ